MKTFAFFLLSFSAVFAFAGTDAKTTAPEPEGAKLWDVTAKTSYVFSSDFDSGDRRLGSQDALGLEFRAVRRIPIQGDWYFKIGAQYDRFDFGSSGAHVPAHLQSVAAVLAIEYLSRGRTGFIFQITPGAYFENDVNAGAFDIPIYAGMAFRLTDNFFLVGGFTAGLLREYPILPALGFVWNVSEQWKINMLVPRPGIIYTPSEKWSFWAGGELVGGAFRTGDSDEPELRNAVVSYREIRAGVAATWKPCPGAELVLGTGWTFERQFDYHRAGRTFTTEGAPYLNFSVQCSF